MSLNEIRRFIDEIDKRHGHEGLPSTFAASLTDLFPCHQRIARFKLALPI
jgi:hypothetical protein